MGGRNESKRGKKEKKNARSESPNKLSSSTSHPSTSHGESSNSPLLSASHPSTSHGESSNSPLPPASHPSTSHGESSNSPLPPVLHPSHWYGPSYNLRSSHWYGPSSSQPSFSSTSHGGNYNSQPSFSSTSHGENYNSQPFPPPSTSHGQCPTGLPGQSFNIPCTSNHGSPPFFQTSNFLRHTLRPTLQTSSTPASESSPTPRENRREQKTLDGKEQKSRFDPQERAALQEFLPFAVGHRKHANRDNIHTVCSEQHAFIQTLPKELQVGYQIQVIPTTKAAKAAAAAPAQMDRFAVDILLNVDVLAELLLREFPEKRMEIYQGARQYLDSRPCEQARIESDPPGTLPPKPCKWEKDRCKINGCQGPHHTVCTIDACGYPVPLCQEIQGVSERDVNYVLIVRDKCYRDFILLPKANVASVPHGNKEWMQSKQSWEVALGYAEELAARVKEEDLKEDQEPFYVNFHLNFGVWESAVAHNPGRFSCHSHLHFLLSREAVLALGKVDKQLEGFLDVPRDEHQRDCGELDRRIAVGDIKMGLEELRTEVRGQITDLRTQVTDLTQAVTVGSGKLDLIMRHLGISHFSD